MDVGNWLRSLGLAQSRGGIPRERDQRGNSAEADARGAAEVGQAVIAIEASVT